MGEKVASTNCCRKRAHSNLLKSRRSERRKARAGADEISASQLPLMSKPLVVALHFGPLFLELGTGPSQTKRVSHSLNSQFLGDTMHACCHLVLVSCSPVVCGGHRRRTDICAGRAGK